MPVFQSIRPPAHSHFWGLTLAVPSLKGEQILVFQQMRDSCITNSSVPNIFSLPSLKALCSESKGPASITHRCVNFTCISFCPARYFAKQNQYRKKTQNKNTHTQNTKNTNKTQPPPVSNQRLWNIFPAIQNHASVHNLSQNYCMERYQEIHRRIDERFVRITINHYVLFFISFTSLKINSFILTSGNK